MKRGKSLAQLEATDQTKELADEMVRARCAHLTPVEIRLARRFANVTPAMVDGPPEGVIVGESPMADTVGRRPLLPWPSDSIGGRLVKCADISPGQYLGRFLRFNLFDAYVRGGDWDADAAVVAAAKLKQSLIAQGSWRMLLIGERVATAFGVDRPWTRIEEWHAQDSSVTYETDIGVNGVSIGLVAIPPPDEVHDERTRFAAGAAVKWVAGYL